jgi:ribose 5-phosphate isomerase B
MNSIVIGCDNAAVNLKNALVDMLRKENYEVEDVGTFSKDDDIVYPLIAEQVCHKIAESNFMKRGVLVCGTGIGMCMTANKVKGIRAAVCHDIFSAQRSILSNNGNVICFGERVIGEELAKTILREWVKLKFVDGPSTPKVQEIINVESRNFV